MGHGKESQVMERDRSVSHKVSTTLDDALMDKVEREAREQLVSVADVLRWAVDAYEPRPKRG